MESDGGTPSSDLWHPHDVGTSVPHAARVYDYWLGGKDNFAADRALAQALLRRIPTLTFMARSNRDFVTRVTTYLARAGIRQFLDIGTGIPTRPNLHETAQGVAPETRVVYVDNDPVVLAHARALMTSTDEGRTAFVEADLRDPVGLLGRPEVHQVLDLSSPVALTAVAVLMLVDDVDDPWRSMEVLRDALPSGSHLALTHPTGDFDLGAMSDVARTATDAGLAFVPRPQADVVRFLGDWELVAPGVVPVLTWRPAGTVPDPYAVYSWAAVARKP